MSFSDKKERQNTTPSLSHTPKIGNNTQKKYTNNSPPKRTSPRKDKGSTKLFKWKTIANPRLFFQFL